MVVMKMSKIRSSKEFFMSTRSKKSPTPPLLVDLVVLYPGNEKENKFGGYFSQVDLCQGIKFAVF